MIDLLLSTPSSVNFHTANLRLNPTHYPTHARVFGPRWISHVQDAWGAGAWYIPQVHLAGKVSLGFLVLPPWTRGCRADR